MITQDTPHAQLVLDCPLGYFEGTITEEQLTNRQLCALLVLTYPGPSALRQEALRRLQSQEEK